MEGRRTRSGRSGVSVSSLLLTAGTVALAVIVVARLAWPGGPGVVVPATADRAGSATPSALAQQAGSSVASPIQTTFEPADSDEGPVASLSPPETPLPSPSPTATDPAPASDDPALVFADTFIAPVWLEGPVAAGIKASYDHGSYRLAGPAIDLPVYVAAPVEAVAGALDVRADLGLGVRDGGGGIFLAAGDTKFGAFVFPDGRVLLVRDSPGSVDVLGQARVGGMGGPVSLELRTDGGRLTVAVDGEAVLSAVQPVRPEEIGLAAWFQEGASAIRVTEFSASRL